MEVGPRRRVPSTAQGYAPLSPPWLGGASFLHDARHACLCLPRFPEPGEQGGPDDLRHGSVRAARHAGRLRVRQDIQELRRGKVEVKRFAHVDA